MHLDWNSFVSVILGGALTLIAAVLTFKMTKVEREKEECREIIPLFNFLVTKVAFLKSLELHSSNIPTDSIVLESELADVNKRYGYVSRALSINEIGEINRFCISLRQLESARSDCRRASRKAYENELRIYKMFLDQAIKHIEGNSEKIGINDIGEKLNTIFQKK